MYKMKRVLSAVLIFLLISGCADSITDIDADVSDPVVKITYPADNDSVGYKGSKVEYELKTFTGINFVEIYVNNAFVENFAPVNNQKPVVNINIDSSLIGSRVELYLIYYDKNGLSYKSSIIKNILVTRDQTPPSIPSGLQVIRIAENTINLSWQDNSPYVTGYEIWRRVGMAGDFIKHITTPPETRNVNDENLAAGVVYFYKIRTISENGLSGFSNIVNSSGSGGSLNVPAPSGLKAQVTNDKVVHLTWMDNSDNENYFKIERRRDWTPYESIGYAEKNSSSYIDSGSGLAGGTEYFYRVKAVSDTDSSWSNEVYLYMPSMFLKQPDILSLTNDVSRRIKIKWRDNDQHYADFIIERKTGNGVFSEIGTAAGSADTYQDAVEPLKKYTYRIRQSLGSINSEYSEEAVIETKVIPLPAPGNINGYFDGYTMIVNWEYNSDADSFVIERKDSTEGSPFLQLAVLSSNERSYADGSTVCQHVYIYRVKAVDPYSTSPYSSEKVLKNWQFCP
jgi:hypothetical protein